MRSERINSRIKSILRSPNPVDEKAENILNVLADPECTVTSLDLYGTYIGPEGAIALAKALEDPNCMLTSLNLRRNDIGNEGAKTLAEALKDPNCTLTSLDSLELRRNNIGPEGAKALAKALEDPNCTLTSLNLAQNNIGPEGAKALADALKDPNCMLTSLNLRFNNIGPEGAQALADALKDPNCTLTSLDLYDNNIGNEGAIAFDEVLKDPRCTLTSLSLGFNNIDSDTRTILFKAVLACAQKGRLIKIPDMLFDETQEQAIQDTYQDVMTTKSHQRLALATALCSSSSRSLIHLLISDLLCSIAEISTTPSDDVLDRFKSAQAKTTHSLPSTVLNQDRPCPANGEIAPSQPNPKRLKSTHN